VLALPDDTVAEFTTLVIDDLAPDLGVVGGVQNAERVTETYRAGANYTRRRWDGRGSNSSPSWPGDR
jgi:hypothetical protein